MQHDLSGLPDPELDAQFYHGVPVKRLLAWLVDSIIALAIWSILVVATFGLFVVFLFPGLLAVNFAYRAYMLDRYSATLGMMIVGIELRDGRGDKLNRQQALWHVALFLSMFVFFFINVISMVTMIFNPRRQGLHDMVLGTAAINRPADS